MPSYRVLNQSGVLDGDEVKPFVASPQCISPFWLDVIAPSDTDVRWLGETFGFHPLTLEDLTGVNTRPKLEEYGDYIFMVVRELIVLPLAAAPTLKANGRGSLPNLEVKDVKAAEVHIYLSARYLITVRDEQQCAVDTVWQRVAANGVHSLIPDATQAASPTPPQPATENKGNLHGSSAKGVPQAARNGEVDELLDAPLAANKAAGNLPAITTLNRNGKQTPTRVRVNPYEPQLNPTDPFSHGLDFLLYNILDNVVDSYFDGLEMLEDGIDALQDRVVDQPTRGILDSIFTLKGNLTVLRKQVTPMREAVNNLTTHSYSFIRQENLIYFRDVYSLLVAVYEIVDTERDNAVSVLDAYLSSVNNNLNIVVKRLTGISVLFLPITAITGFAGMNLGILPNPETWYNLLVLLLIISVPTGMLLWFKKQDWLL